MSNTTSDTQKSGLILDGIAASSAIDKSQESIDLEGMDISTFTEGKGIAIYEHKKPKDAGATALDNVGHVIKAKKIFSEKDCSNQRELNYWEKVKLPFLYCQIELYDGEGHANAMALAAQCRYYKKRNLPLLVRYSIDGSTLQKDGNTIKRSIARKIALTITPCNESCSSDILHDPSQPVNIQEADTIKFEDLESERLVSFEVESDSPIIEKSLDDHPAFQAALESKKKVDELAATGPRPYRLRHKTNGHFMLVSEDASKNGGWRVTHFTPELSPINHIEAKDHYEALKIAAQSGADLDNEIKKSEDSDMEKALTAGGSDVAPSALTGGAALAKESIGGRVRKVIGKWDRKKPLKELLRAEIADGDLEKLDSFADTVEKYMLKKSEDMAAAIPAPKTKFQGHDVEPGILTLLDDEGSPVKNLPLLGNDDKYYYIQSNGNLKKLSANLNGTMFVVAAMPHAVVSAHEAEKHESNPHIHSDYLVEGLDLNRLDHHDSIGYNKYGNKVIVKSAIDDTGEVDSLTRELAYCLIAKELLGDLVPKAILISNKEKTDKHLVVEWKDGIHPEHYDSNKTFDSDTQGVLEKLNSSGLLEKLAFVDTVLGMSDRKVHQFMVDVTNDAIYLVNNQYAFTCFNKTPEYLLNGSQSPETMGEFISKVDPSKITKTLQQLSFPNETIHQVMDALFKQVEKYGLGTKEKQESPPRHIGHVLLDLFHKEPR